MADNWSKEQTKYLLSLYRESECLYNIYHPDYLKKNKKYSDFVRIEREMKELKPDITIQGIKNKIRTITNQVSKERQKMKRSRRSGAGLADVYTPKLWCYKDLEFLFHLNDEKMGESNMDLLEENKTTEFPDVEEAEEAAELQISKKCKSNTVVHELKQNAEKSLHLISEFFNNRPADKNRQSLFCDLLCQKLKDFKLQETLDDLEIDILNLVNEARKKETQRLNAINRESFSDWRNVPSTSSTPINFTNPSLSRTTSLSSTVISSVTSSPLDYSDFEVPLTTNKEKVVIQNIEIVKPPELDEEECSNQTLILDENETDVLALASQHIFYN